MLSNVSLWLINNGYHVSVIARNPKRMKNLTDKVREASNVTPILVDYTNGKDLSEKLKYAIQRNGGFDMVIAWIHSIAENALEIICQEASNYNKEWDLFHVLGSSSNINKIKEKAPVPNNCLYHQVQLGYVIEDNRSRWLTNQEISGGILEAIRDHKYIHTVGVIEPWDKRP